MASFYEQLAAATRPFALALIAGTKGSSPQRTGAKAMFYADGKITGTLGGGCLEAEVQARALTALKTGQPAAFNLVLDHDFGWDDGLICGGSVQGLILPQAAQAQNLWRQLAAVTSPIRWGVRPVSGNRFATCRIVDRRFRTRGPGCHPARAATGFYRHRF